MCGPNHLKNMKCRSMNLYTTKKTGMTIYKNFQTLSNKFLRKCPSNELKKIFTIIQLPNTKYSYHMSNNRMTKITLISWIGNAREGKTTKSFEIQES